MIHSEPTMKRAGGPMSAEDRLSALPDGLLHAIMSFLPAPQSVQTSLLSRRWRHLWRSAPLIKIDSHDFGISGITSRDTVGERWARFEDFATNLLLFHDNTSSLGAFHLRSRLHNMRHVVMWIDGFAVVLSTALLCSRFRYWALVMVSSCLWWAQVSVVLKGCVFVVLFWMVISQALSALHALSWKIWIFNYEMLIENSEKFPIFDTMRTLDFYGYFRNEYELNDKLKALQSFIENAPCLEKLILQYCMFYSFSDSEWEPERKNITLHHHGNIFQCQKLKLIEVIYDYDHDHQLIELLWSLGRSLPDASIKLSKIELFP